MQGIENKLLVLKLNKNWKVVDQGLVCDALVDLAAGVNSEALDIDYARNKDGTVDFKNATMLRPVEWDEWITLPIRDWDFSIRTVNRVIRVPTILIAKNYDKIPVVKFGKNPSTEQVRMRDGDVCQYTGRRLRREEISIDHVVPKSRGGGEGWLNKVVTSKDFNARKGNHLNSEIGAHLIRQPTVPKPIPRYKLIRQARHADWALFLEEVEA